MSLNIKNERTHALVRELAAATGLSQTSAVEEAVSRRLAEIRAGAPHDDARRVRVDRVVAAYRTHLTDADRERLESPERELYDELGLPR